MSTAQPELILEIPDADPYGDGSSVTGRFELASIGWGLETRTEQFFESSGLSASLVDTIVDWIADSGGPADGIRQTLALDLGEGVHVCNISFRAWEGSSLQWGDGSGDPRADASGADPRSQMVVFDRYLQTARMDSENTPRLHIPPFYEPDGHYEAPLGVVPETPTVRFESEEDVSGFTGEWTWVEVMSLDGALDTADQEEYA